MLDECSPKIDGGIVVRWRRSLLTTLALALALAQPMRALVAQEASLELIASPQELEVAPCSTLEITVVLETDPDPSPELTGLGVQAFWDSSQLGLPVEDTSPPVGVPDAVTDVFLPPGAENPLTSFQIIADDANGDQDPATDRALRAVWLFGFDVTSQGTGATSSQRQPASRQRLFTLELETMPGFSGTTVNLVVSESPPGFTPSRGRAVIAATGEPCRR